MKISLYNSMTSQLDMPTESTYLHPYLVMADQVYYYSATSECLLIYMCFDTLPEKFILYLAKSAFKDDDREIRHINGLIEMLPNIKKIRNKQHKDKDMLVALGRYKQLYNIVKGNLYEYYEKGIIRHRLKDMIPFVENGTWQVEFLNSELNTKVESKFISGIADALIQRDTILSADYKIENVLTHITTDQTDNKPADFIKIPLWTFPPITQISYEQMKYTREQSKPFFDPFKSQLNDIVEQISGLPYTADNIGTIITLCNEKLLTQKTTIQHEIHESIYLSRLRNNYPAYFGIEFCLGISSAENIVNYFEKNKILEPYMAEEIKLRISRKMDLQTSSVFSYFVLHGANEDGN